MSDAQRSTPAAGNRAVAVRMAFDAWSRGDFEFLRGLYAPDATDDGGALWPEDAGTPSPICSMAG